MAFPSDAFPAGAFPSDAFAALSLFLCLSLCPFASLQAFHRPTQWWSTEGFPTLYRDGSQCSEGTDALVHMGMGGRSSSNRGARKQQRVDMEAASPAISAGSVQDLLESLVHSHPFSLLGTPCAVHHSTQWIPLCVHWKESTCSVYTNCKARASGDCVPGLWG